MRSVALIALMAVGASAHALLIDGFSTGTYDVTLKAGQDMNLQAAPDAIGGERVTIFGVLGNPHKLSFNLSISDGLYVSSPTGGTALSQIQWGAFHSLDLDLSNLKDLRVHFAGNDQDQLFQLDLSSPSSFNGHVLRSVLGGRPDTAFDVDFDLSELGPQFDLAHVSTMSLWCVGAKSGDYGISMVEAVPEPASIAVLGLGIVGLITRRRNRS